MGDVLSFRQSPYRVPAPPNAPPVATERRALAVPLRAAFFVASFVTEWTRKLGLLPRRWEHAVCLALLRATIRWCGGLWLPGGEWGDRDDALSRVARVERRLAQRLAREGRRG